MLDHSNHLSSFHPPYQTHGSYDHAGDIEFEFWAARETQYSDVDFNEKVSGGGGGGEVEFHQPQFEVDFDDHGYNPLPFRKTEMRDDDVIYESSPLLPYNHNSSINVCPRSAWSKEIAEGRKQLMEMVRSMPESSYELSLKDIVDEQHASQRVLLQEDNSTEESFQFETEPIKSQMKKKTSGKKKSGHISRSGSMEKETLMIKMFIPISLISWKTRAKERHGSKVSPRTSLDASDNHVAKHFGTKRVSVTSESKSSVRSSSSGGGGGSRSNSTKSRHNSSCSFLGCWPIFAKNSRRRQKVCTS